MTEEALEIRNKLLKWAGFSPAPGCLHGCHMLAPESYKVIPTGKALRISASKLHKETRG